MVVTWKNPFGPDTNPILTNIWKCSYSSFANKNRHLKHVETESGF